MHFFCPQFSWWVLRIRLFVTMILRIKLFCYDGSENQAILLRWFWESDYFAALPSAPPALSWSGRKWPQCLSMDKLLFWLAAPLHPHPPPSPVTQRFIHGTKLRGRGGGLCMGGGGGGCPEFNQRTRENLSKFINTVTTKKKLKEARQRAVYKLFYLIWNTRVKSNVSFQFEQIIKL